MNRLVPALRFVAVTGTVYALIVRWPGIVLGVPGWLTWLIVPQLQQRGGWPEVVGSAVEFQRAGGPLRLEDPYLIAGIPLYLGLWSIVGRTWSKILWPRVAVGFLVLFTAGTLALMTVEWSLDRGYMGTPTLEPLEGVALFVVASMRVLPILLWLLLDPAQPFAALRGRQRFGKPKRLGTREGCSEGEAHRSPGA